uniref:Large polyvalent protein associated domain-containing protein n=1 Tax=viral metagenome TaxID=1070528 RepID=A0A6M3J4T5_9ZZZZ
MTTWKLPDYDVTGEGSLGTWEYTPPPRETVARNENLDWALPKYTPLPQIPQEQRIQPEWRYQPPPITPERQVRLNQYNQKVLRAKEITEQWKAHPVISSALASSEGKAEQPIAWGKPADLFKDADGIEGEIVYFPSGELVFTPSVGEPTFIGRYDLSKPEGERYVPATDIAPTEQNRGWVNKLLTALTYPSLGLRGIEAWMGEKAYEIPITRGIVETLTQEQKPLVPIPDWWYPVRDVLNPKEILKIERTLTAPFETGFKIREALAKSGKGEIKESEMYDVITKGQAVALGRFDAKPYIQRIANGEELGTVLDEMQRDNSKAIAEADMLTGLIHDPLLFLGLGVTAPVKAVQLAPKLSKAGEVIGINMNAVRATEAGVKGNEIHTLMAINNARKHVDDIADVVAATPGTTEDLKALLGWKRIIHNSEMGKAGIFNRIKDGLVFEVTSRLNSVGAIDDFIKNPRNLGKTYFARQLGYHAAQSQNDIAKVTKKIFEKSIIPETEAAKIGRDSAKFYLSEQAKLADLQSAIVRGMEGSIKKAYKINDPINNVDYWNLINRGVLGAKGKIPATFKQPQLAQRLFINAVTNLNHTLSYVFLGTPRYVIRNMLNNTFQLAFDSMGRGLGMKYAGDAAMKAEGFASRFMGFGAAEAKGMTPKIWWEGIKQNPWKVVNFPQRFIEFGAMGEGGMRRMGDLHNYRMVKGMISADEIVRHESQIDTLLGSTEAASRIKGQIRSAYLRGGVEELKQLKVLSDKVNTEYLATKFGMATADKAGYPKVLNETVKELDDIIAKGGTADDIRFLEKRKLDEINQIRKDLDLTEITEEQFKMIGSRYHQLMREGISEENAFRVAYAEMRFDDELQIIVQNRLIQSVGEKHGVKITEAYKGYRTSRDAAYTKWVEGGTDEIGYAKYTAARNKAWTKASGDITDYLKTQIPKTTKKGKVDKISDTLGVYQEVWNDYDKALKGIYSSYAPKKGGTWTLENFRKWEIESTQLWDDTVRKFLKGLDEFDGGKTIHQTTPLTNEAMFIDKSRQVVREANWLRDFRHKYVDFKGEKLSPLSIKESEQLNTIIDDAIGNLDTINRAANAIGQQLTDFSLLNYGHVNDIDMFLKMIFPWEFWTTRSLYNWGVRAVERPWFLAGFQDLRESIYNTENEMLPSRLRDKIKVNIPFIDKMLPHVGSMFADPIKVFFPVADWMDAYVNKQAEETAGGQLVNFANQFGVSPSPIIQYFLAASGQLGEFAKQFPVGYTPPEELLQVMTSFLQPYGVKFRENPVYDYYIRRELSSMAAEGKYEPKALEQVMVDKKGAIYDEAVKRANEQWQLSRGMGILTGFPLYALATGEEKQYATSKDFQEAYKKYIAGDVSALDNFYDAHPEYRVKQMSYIAEPEEMKATYKFQTSLDDAKQKEAANERDFMESRISYAKWQQERGKIAQSQAKAFEDYYKVIKREDSKLPWKQAADRFGEYIRNIANGDFNDSKGSYDWGMRFDAEKRFLSGLDDETRAIVEAYIESNRTPLERRYYQMQSEIAGINRQITAQSRIKDDAYKIASGSFKPYKERTPEETYVNNTVRDWMFIRKEYDAKLNEAKNMMYNIIATPEQLKTARGIFDKYEGLSREVYEAILTSGEKFQNDKWFQYLIEQMKQDRLEIQRDRLRLFLK